MSGEQLYDAYREERIQQGWQEFLWKSMSKPQQLVWEKLARRLQQPAPAAPQSSAQTLAFTRKQ